MKKRNRRLNLTRETLTHLDPETLNNLGGMKPTIDVCCQESIVVCSIQHTCWSCNNETELCA